MKVRSSQDVCLLTMFRPGPASYAKRKVVEGSIMSAFTLFIVDFMIRETLSCTETKKRHLVDIQKRNLRLSWKIFCSRSYGPRFGDLHFSNRPWVDIDVKNCWNSTGSMSDSRWLGLRYTCTITAPLRTSASRSLCTSLSRALCILPFPSLSAALLRSLREPLLCWLWASLPRCPLTLVMTIVLEKYAMSTSRRLANHSLILTLRIACVAGLKSSFR